MPTEQKQTEIFYVHDGFGKESWHYAASKTAAIKAHKYHFFGNDGLQKEFKEEPKVVPTTTVIENVICLEEPCCNFAGIPTAMARRLNADRLGVVART